MAFTLLVRGGPMADPARVLSGEVGSGVEELTEFLKRKVKEGTPAPPEHPGSTNTARGSIASEVSFGEVVGGFGVPIGRVGSPQVHVQVINDGRRPGQRPPPSDALELWVRRTLRIERRHADGRAKTRKGKVLSRAPTVAEARGLAFVIARAIGERGTEGVHMFENAVEENTGTIQRILERMGAGITIELVKT